MTVVPQRLKQYKAVQPEETIKKIETILVDNNIKVQVADTSAQDLGFYSCHLEVLDIIGKNPIFFCNGKGMSRDYAKASAYGELMERLQNLTFYMSTIYFSEPENSSKKNQSKDSFQYFPDERIITAEQLSYEHFDIMRFLFNFSGDYPKDLANFLKTYFGWNQMKCVPFQDIFQDKTVWLPVRFLHWIIGSNGMCVGNTREEALIHGISEILERHVLKTLYSNPIALPEIDENYFSDTEVSRRLSNFKDIRHLSFRIKDCSLGQNLPVIGLLIENKEKDLYDFHLGADPSPITALERCLTEMLQGGNFQFKRLNDRDHRFLSKEHPRIVKKHFHRSILAYAGFWPLVIFDDNLEKAFSGFNHPVSMSDEDDLSYLIKLIEKLGYKFLIRETSFLGFPSYHVVIPGMSGITTHFDNEFLYQLTRFEKDIRELYSWPVSSTKQRLKLLKVIREFKNAAYSGEFFLNDYYRHFQDIDQLAMDFQRSLEEISQSNNTSKEVFNSPVCFKCNNCLYANKCNFESLQQIWQTVKSKFITCKLSAEAEGKT
jgi:ribosomal protein S12 methylthiotransferase accessory factor